jgi:hypothetical protein
MFHFRSGLYANTIFSRLYSLQRQKIHSLEHDLLPTQVEIPNSIPPEAMQRVVILAPRLHLLEIRQRKEQIV